MTRVVLCLDKLKGSLTAAEACAALAEGITEAQPGWDVRQRPVADGGEGTVDALVAAGWQRVTVTVTGPLGAPVVASLAVRGDRAVVEMAQASGLALVPPAPDPLRAGTAALDPLRADTAALDPLRAGTAALDPLRAGTGGTGELVRAALDRGCTEIVLAVGGSASTDGGAGMLQALGASITTDTGQQVAPGGAALAGVVAVDLTGLDPRLAHSRVVLASDVENPLLGPDGAAAVYGPQKGATPEQVDLLEAALRTFVDAVPDGRRYAELPGAGAAGGTGFAALAALGAQRTSGADLVLTETALAADVEGAHLVVVGEGRLDEQSLAGKAPVRVAALAQRCGVPVVGVAGEVAVDPTRLRAAGITSTHQLLDHAPDRATAITDAARLLRVVGRLLAQQHTSAADG